MTTTTPPTSTALTPAQKEYAARERRILDAIELRTPDRLPSVLFCHFWAGRRTGMTCKQIMHDYDGLKAAMISAVQDLEPDAYYPVHTLMGFGPTMEILDYRQLEWPGHNGLPEDVTFQYPDREYMKASEFTEYLQDPTGWYLHRYLPRVAGAFEPFAMLPEFPSVFHTRILQSVAVYAIPEVRGMLETLLRAGEEMQKVFATMERMEAELAALGFPCGNHATSHAPFDVVADYMRGSKGAMLDMFRNKNALLAVLDRITEIIPRNSVATARRNKGRMIFIPLHWGLDDFMSPDQFKTFYWPQLRKVMLHLIDNGFIPQVLWEGNCRSRLDIIKDVPPGKCVYFFERTDMFEAKRVLGGTVCIRGNVPVSLLVTGTPAEVREYCKKLFDVCGDGGGFILDGAVGIPDEAKPENVTAMFEFAKECKY